MWNGHKIAYISATFLGTRGGQKKGTINFYANTYLPCLFEHATCIDRIIIPCNADKHHLSHYEELEEIVAKLQKTTDIPITLFRRPNEHFSYGAWNAALQKHCDDIDFAFLLEDDYVVCKHGFDAEILSRYYSTEEDRENVLFCASWFLSTGEHDPGHAAISNGLINVNLFRSNGNIFHLSGAAARNGPIAQAQFLTAFKDKGLSIRNMAAEYYMPFMHYRAAKMSYYGNPKGPVVFVPLQLVVKGAHKHGMSAVEAQQKKVHILPEDLHVVDLAGFSVLSGGATVDA